MPETSTQLQVEAGDRESATVADRFTLAAMLRRAPVVEKERFIEDACRDKVVLDLGCVRHSAEFATSDPNWLHGRIFLVAARTVGVDYLAEEVEKLKNTKYHIVWGDVTRPLPIDEQFDVIVAGDLIEHVTNFEGFFENCRRLLRKDGRLIITTPNPFYSGEFHYIAFKRQFIINPEHTCWIDPQALAQLAARFSFTIEQAHYLNQAWNFANFLCENRNNQYDIHSGVWSDQSFASKVKRHALALFFNLFYRPFRYLTGGKTRLVGYADYVAVLRRM